MCHGQSDTSTSSTKEDRPQYFQAALGCEKLLLPMVLERANQAWTNDVKCTRSKRSHGLVRFDWVDMPHFHSFPIFK